MPTEPTDGFKAPLKVIRNIGRLCTMAPAAKKQGRRLTADDLGWVTDAAILIDQGRVIACGTETSVLNHRDLQTRKVEEFDLASATVIPGLIECHTHLVFAGNRAAEFERRNLGESYQSIAKSGGGILSTVRATRETSAEDLARVSQTRANRFLKQGVSTIEIKSGYGLNLETEMKMLRVAKSLRGPRIVPTFLGAHAIPKEIGDADRFVDLLITEALPAIRSEGLATRVDIFVEDGYFSEATAYRYFEAAKALGFQTVVHAEQLTRAGGARLAVESGSLSADHLVEIDSSDIRGLANSDVTCVLLPSSDLYMKLKYPPARELIDSGARVAIATDYNPGTCPSQDVALVGVLSRIEMKMTLPEVLGAYTIGAAHALQLQHELGSIEVGKKADFNVLEGAFEELFLDVGHMPIQRVFREGEQLFSGQMSLVSI